MFGSDGFIQFEIRREVAHAPRFFQRAFPALQAGPGCPIALKSSAVIVSLFLSDSFMFLLLQC